MKENFIKESFSLKRFFFGSIDRKIIFSFLILGFCIAVMGTIISYNSSINSFSCTNPVNQSANLTCTINLSDDVGLSYAIIGINGTGSWVNSSQISLSGKSSYFNYTINSINNSIPIYSTEILVYASSGRSSSSTYNITVLDDIFPQIYNFTYSPNTTNLVRPDTNLSFNVTIFENYNMSYVQLMYKELTQSSWAFINMTNNSALIVGANSTIVYNASFAPSNGTWTFKINSTDAQGNQNVSSSTTIIAANKTSFFNSTTIPSIKSIVLSEESDTTVLGEFYLNNTGDTFLNFTVNITSSLGSRFNLNYTLNQSGIYNASSGAEVNLTILVNTTSLPTGLYDYNLTVSSDAGTTVLPRQLNIQTSTGAYLITSIDTYSNSVTRGQTGVTFVSSVTNLGTADATGVYLNWTLPSAFSLVSGNYSRNLGNLPVGLSGTNSITISVSGSTTDSNVNMLAVATGENITNSTAVKSVTITDPLTPSGGGTSTGGGGGGTSSLQISGTASKINEFSKTIEVVRGKKGSEFSIEVKNNYSGFTFKDISLVLDTSLPKQYIEFSPSTIYTLNNGQSQNFTIKVNAPSYMPYEEYNLVAKITGKVVSANVTGDYKETQNIKLIVEEVDRKTSFEFLQKARIALDEMIKARFNVEQATNNFNLAETKLDNRRNKESLDLSEQLISTKDNAFLANNLIRRVLEADINPHKSSILLGNSIKEFDSVNNQLSLPELFNKKTSFSSDSVREIVGLSIAAFERGDYELAKTRAMEAQSALILERKGNLGLFFYLYWYFILIGAIFLVFVGLSSRKIYNKSTINQKIIDLNREEMNISNLMILAQNKYFSGKLSSLNYNREMAQHQKRVAEIKKKRFELRNKRVSFLRKENLMPQLKLESMQVEGEIRRLQKMFYTEGKISKQQYDIQFAVLQERLGEIESERTSLEIKKGEKRR